MKRLLPNALAAVLLGGFLVVLAGCGKFFTPITTCTTNCTPASTSDFLYVGNQRTAGASIAGFSIASAALTTVTNSPYALAVLPTALAINPANTFLYVGSADGLIYLYAINSDGSLTIQNSGTAVASTIAAASMQVDSTGTWLLVASSTDATVSAFSINTTTGTLTTSTAGPVVLNAGVGTPSSLVITPNNAFVYISLGTKGVEVLTFSSSDGTLTDVGNLATKGGQDADSGLAVNPLSTFLFITETGVNGVRVASIGASGGLTEVTGSPFATGLGPSAVLVDSTGSYVYVTNRTDSTVSAFLLTNAGSLTAVSGSPFATGTSPIAIAEDSSATYVSVVSLGGSPDLQLYSFDATTPGKLDVFTSAVTGTDPTIPVAIAATR